MITPLEEFELSVYLKQSDYKGINHSSLAFDLALMAEDKIKNSHLNNHSRKIYQVQLNDYVRIAELLEKKEKTS